MPHNFTCEKIFDSHISTLIEKANNPFHLHSLSTEQT